MLHFTLDPYLIILSIKQGGIKYNFFSLWYDSNWDWTLVSRPLVNTLLNRPMVRCFTVMIFKLWWIHIILGLYKLVLISIYSHRKCLNRFSLIVWERFYLFSSNKDICLKKYLSSKNFYKQYCKKKIFCKQYCKSNFMGGRNLVKIIKYWLYTDWILYLFKYIMLIIKLTHSHKYNIIKIYIYICVCVCVCVCERDCMLYIYISKYLRYKASISYLY